MDFETPNDSAVQGRLVLSVGQWHSVRFGIDYGGLDRVVMDSSIPMRSEGLRSSCDDLSYPLPSMASAASPNTVRQMPGT